MINESDKLPVHGLKEKDLVSFIRANLIEGKAENIVEVSVLKSLDWQHISDNRLG